MLHAFSFAHSHTSPLYHQRHGFRLIVFDALPCAGNARRRARRRPTGVVERLGRIDARGASRIAVGAARGQSVSRRACGLVELGAPSALPVPLIEASIAECNAVVESVRGGIGPGRRAVDADEAGRVSRVRRLPPPAALSGARGPGAGSPARRVRRVFPRLTRCAFLRVVLGHRGARNLDQPPPNPARGRGGQHRGMYLLVRTRTSIITLARSDGLHPADRRGSQGWAGYCHRSHGYGYILKHFNLRARRPGPAGGGWSWPGPGRQGATGPGPSR
jgi:hypothetical protein